MSHFREDFSEMTLARNVFWVLKIKPISISVSLFPFYAVDDDD